MIKLKKSEAGFSAVEIVLVIAVVALIGLVGWLVYKNHHKTATVAVVTAKSTPGNTKPITTTKTTTTQSTDPYAGWKTYSSILNSGLSFKYPASWVFTPATQAPTPNNLGGVENDSVLYSVAPTTSPGQDAAVPTNQFMCVTFDEYSGNGWQQSNWSLGSILTSQQVNANNTNLSLVTYKGATPMQDEMVLYNPADTANGNHFINTNNGYVVSVSAQFNCQQGGFPAGANLNADFTQQPETATAKLIMQSIKW